MRRHDRVIDLELDDHKGDKKNKSDHKGCQGLGRRPAGFRTLAEVIDHSDNTKDESQDTKDVNSSVLDFALRLFCRDNDDTKERQREANDSDLREEDQ